jgi:hypothetical protein
MTVDDYVNALAVELRDQPRSVRRRETKDLREHLEELPPDALAGLDEPAAYAREYRAQRGFRTKKFIGTWRLLSRPEQLAGVVFVVLLVAVVVIPTTIAHYQPVTADVQFGGPDAVSPVTQDNAEVFQYRDNGIVRIGIVFDNTGRLGAKITGIAPQPELSALKLVGIGVLKSPDCCASQFAHPARFPVSIPAGQTRAVVLEFRMAKCEYYLKHDSVGYSQLTFPITVFGVHHVLTAQVVPPIFIDMPGPSTPACPRHRPPELEP